MVQNTIEKIEEKIRANKSLNESDKTQLLSLLAALKPEYGEILERPGRACRKCRWIYRTLNT